MTCGAVDRDRKKNNFILDTVNSVIVSWRENDGLTNKTFLSHDIYIWCRQRSKYGRVFIHVKAAAWKGNNEEEVVIMRLPSLHGSSLRPLILQLWTLTPTSQPSTCSGLNSDSWYQKFYLATWHICIFTQIFCSPSCACRNSRVFFIFTKVHFYV